MGATWRYRRIECESLVFPGHDPPKAKRRLGMVTRTSTSHFLLHRVTNGSSALLRSNNGYRFDLDQELFSRQSANFNQRACWRSLGVDIRVPNFSQGLYLLHVDDVIIKFDELLETCTGGLERFLQVLKDLPALSAEVVFTYNVPALIQGN